MAYTSLLAKTGQKQLLKPLLKRWLSLLDGDLTVLEERLIEIAKDNPYLRVDSRMTKNETDLIPRIKNHPASQNSGLDEGFFDRIADNNKSLFETLIAQIEAPLFPTERSQRVALTIIDDINNEGYFEGSIEVIAQEYNIEVEEAERIRQRFAYLEPSGVGAIDINETLLFQLENLELSEELYNYTRSLLCDWKSLEKHTKEPLFLKAKAIIRKMYTPPAIEFLADERPIIPDLVVRIEDGKTEININNSYYPDVIIEESNVTCKLTSAKYREAKEIIKFIAMRKSTLLQVAILLVNHQKEYFYGEEMQPLRIKHIAQELGYHSSTISRTISGKYLSCDRGIIKLRDFFMHEVAKGVTSREIKNFLISLVEKENRDQPMDDHTLQIYINNHFSLSLVKRSIAKYRTQMQIPAALERAKLYKING